MNRAQRYYVDFTIDVSIYAIVLNLFEEFVDSVVIESFAVSLLTAVLLKFALDVIEAAAGAVKRRIGSGESRSIRYLQVVAPLVILFISKFAILITVEILFEDDVDLGGFINVTILVVSMMAARVASALGFKWLGERNMPTQSKDSDRA